MEQTSRKERRMIFGFISKKKLYEEVNRLYQLNNAEKAYSNEDWHYRCGCANVCNYLCSKFNLPKLALLKPYERNDDE